MSYYQNSYSAGDTFTDFQGNKYTVVTGGNTPSTPFDSSNIVNDLIVWGDLELEPVAEGGTGQGLVDYQPNKSYSVGDIVLYNDKIYKCITAHTSTSTFDDTKWEEISGGGTLPWEANTKYSYGNTVIYDNLIYYCITAHTSTSVFEEQNWRCLSGDVITGCVNREVLYSGWFTDFVVGTDSLNTTNSLELSNSIENYDQLEIAFVTSGENSPTPTLPERHIFLLNVADVVYGRMNTRATITVGALNNYFSYNIAVVDSTHIGLCSQFYAGWSFCGITSVVGIKYNHMNFGVEAVNVTLWEGQGTQGQTLTLSDDVANYDQIIMYSANSSEGVVATGFINPKEEHVIFNSWRDDYYCSGDVQGNTFSVVAAVNIYVKRIVGVKYIQQDRYSTTEKLIGTWIDGKPLYRKVFEPSSTTFSTGLSTSVASIKRVYGQAEDSSGNSVYLGYNDGTSRISIYVNKSTGDATVDTNLNITYYYVVVEYTKN